MDNSTNENYNLIAYENFNNREIATILEENWEQFVENGLESKLIRKDILRSWLRCRNNSVDPLKGYNNLILNYDNFKEHYNEAMELINVAMPFMHSLYNSLKGSGYIVMLFDKDGIILEMFGDGSMRRIAESLDAVPGATCDESVIGTTAPGICLKEKIPVQVFYKEHFCIPYHNWACSAAPIFDPEGRLIGSLDLTGLYENFHPHTLGMVVATVKAIERELCYRAVNKRLKKTYHYLDTIINSMSEGMISFNNEGQITHLNKVCANMLGLTIQDCLKTPLHKIFKNAHILTGLVSKNTHIINKELTLITKKGPLKVNANFKAVKTEDEKDVTYVGTLHELAKIPRTPHKNVDFVADYTFEDIIFVSAKMRKIIEYAQKISTTDSTVLIEGESGTGKELLAQAIHNNGIRKKNPFVVVNCASLPKELIQSELFGYDEGAFTGARRGGKIGKFELANGGTIFLDEIGDMPLEVQANILRVLQEKKFIRVGGSRNIELDIQVIAATNKRLTEEVEKGTFRLDLFYRLNIMPIEIPPLRERTEDILPLARYFLERLCLSLGRSQIKLSPEVEKIFLSYSWPGNIRELENILNRIVNILEGDTVFPEHLPGELKKLQLDEAVSIISLEELEKKAIINALNYYGMNISRAAQGLGITRSTLYKKIKKHKLG